MAQNESELSSVIERLMNDGEAQRLIEKLKSELDGHDGEAGARSVEAESTDTQATGESGEATVNAQLVERLPEVISALSPLIKQSERAPSGNAPSRRNELLRALKPYLSDSRRQLVDKIMQLSRVGELMDMLPHDR